jgi:hypothetical protein
MQANAAAARNARHERGEREFRNMTPVYGCLGESEIEGTPLALIYGGEHGRFFHLT